MGAPLTTTPGSHFQQLTTSAVPDLTLSTGIQIFSGTGVPSIAAPQGSLYLRTDGSSTSTRAYINTNGSTGWTNLTTGA